MAGAPKGNRNNARGTKARIALEKAIRKASGVNVIDGRDEFEALVDMWSVQIGKALDGDNNSASMIFDRLDGKPTQATEIDATLNHRDVTELTDEELVNIATKSSE